MPQYIPKPGMKLISLKLPEAYIKGLDELVNAHLYPSRAEAIRLAIKDLLETQEKYPIKELIYRTIPNADKTPAEIMQEREKYKK